VDHSIEGCATNATCRPAHKFIASLHHFTHPSRAALHALRCIACIALQSMQGFATQFENYETDSLVAQLAISVVGLFCIERFLAPPGRLF
jgi:hypothetical protein